MDPTRLVRELDEFISLSASACVLEEGEVLFDLTAAKFSISGEQGKCLLHLWSAERNTVRRIVDLERKQGILKLAAQRFGKGKPSWLEIVPAVNGGRPAFRSK